MKLRVKVFLYLIVSIAVVFTISVGYINYRYWSYTRDMTVQVAEVSADRSAAIAKGIIEKDLETVKVLENIFKGYKKIPENVRKDVYNQILSDVLTNNTQFLSVWMSWELNVIDPEWDVPYGRQRTVAHWDKGNVVFVVDSPNVDGDIPGSEYLQLKIGAEQNILGNPYLETYANDTGSVYLVTSIAKGIYDDDRFVGAVGVDVLLERFQNVLSNLHPFKNSKIIVVSNNGRILADYDDFFLGKQIDRVYPEFNRFDILSKIKAGKDFSFYTENEKGETDFISFYPIKIEGTTMPWSLAFVISSDVIIKDIKKNARLLIILSVISFFVISLVIWLIVSSIVGSIKDITIALEKIGAGNVYSGLKIKQKSNDELGSMANSVNNLIDSLLVTQKFAQEIGTGNLSAKYELHGQHDILGESLIEMRDNLRKAQKQEKSRKEESEKILWMQNGITKVNEIYREKSESIELLSAEIIKFLVNYTNAVQGGFYLIEEKDKKKYIELKAAYAYDRKKEMSASLELGEGLIGRVIKEKQILKLSNLPEGYLFVRSGLGERSPQNLIVVPLIFEDTVLGAIELAGFKEYTETDIEFLSQVAIRITSSVSVLLKNVETAKLLKESQLQTATFEMKERQFLRQRKKISEKQKLMEQKMGYLNVALDALKTFGLFLVLDEKLNIIETNNYILNEFEITQDEIIGKNITDITVLQKTATLWFKKFWDDVLNGQIRKKATIYKWKNHKLEVSETAFMINSEDVKKIIVIGIK